MVGEHGGDGFLQLVDDLDVLDGGGDFVELLVIHLAHYVAEVFAAAGLRQTVHHMACLETCDWADLLTNQSHDLLLYLCRIVFIPCLYSHKSNWHLPFYLILRAYHNSLCDLLINHYRLFHLTRRQPMTCCIDNIIHSRHNREISILINHSTVTSVVVPFECFEVLVDIKLVVV